MGANFQKRKGGKVIREHQLRYTGVHKYYKHAPVLHPGDNVEPTLSKSGD